MTDITAMKTSKSSVVVCFLETLSQSLNLIEHTTLIFDYTHLVLPANRAWYNVNVRQINKEVWIIDLTFSTIMVRVENQKKTN